MLLDMIDVNAWAPYVSNPLALVAFVLLVILLAMLKVPASSTFLKVLACILIVAVTAALLLAGFSEYKRHEKPDVVSAGAPAPASVAPPGVGFCATASKHYQCPDGTRFA
ncbi:hypothetical protein PPS11_04405 [Pseudomonas putida S11]|nr:hypothetical protein PPS11_04405 [Pseudomonas putida S11]